MRKYFQNSDLLKLKEMYFSANALTVKPWAEPSMVASEVRRQGRRVSRQVALSPSHTPSHPAASQLLQSCRRSWHTERHKPYFTVSGLYIQIVTSSCRQILTLVLFCTCLGHLLPVMSKTRKEALPSLPMYSNYFYIVNDSWRHSHLLQCFPLSSLSF